MSLSHAGSAARACAPIFRKTPPHVHPIINMAADVCPVLPKFHPSRNLNSMGASLWNKFEKECPFAKVVQKNISGSSQQSSAARLPHLRPERLPTRSEQPLVVEEVVCPVQAEAPKKLKVEKRTSYSAAPAVPLFLAKPVSAHLRTPESPLVMITLRAVVI